MNEVLIELKDVHKSFPVGETTVQVLKNISFEIKAGEFVAIIGQSGSGKSTLLNMLTGVDRPTSGEVVVAGQKLVGMSEDELAIWRRTSIGIVFQFFNLVPGLTLAQNVRLPMDLAATIPKRSTLATQRVIGYYAVVIGTALATFMLPVPLRQIGLIALLIAVYAGFGVAGYQFLQTIQIVQPAYPRAAQQARLVLLSLAVAEAPFLLLPWSQFIRLLIPYEVLVGAQIIRAATGQSASRRLAHTSRGWWRAGWLLLAWPTPFRPHV